MGGNIFNTTAPIKKEHIETTLKRFYEHMGIIFPNAKKYFKDLKTLGSVGKKDYSGDIDLAMAGSALHKLEDWGIDKQTVQDYFDKFRKRARTSTDEMLMKRAVITAIGDKVEEANTDIEVDKKGASAGALFLAFPQFDENNKKLPVSIQIDIDFGDVSWLEFAKYSSVYKGNVKGLHRTQLMIAMFAEKGYTFSHNYGVKNKETQEIVADTPQKAIALLNKLYNTKLNTEILSDYFKLVDVVKNQLTQEETQGVLDRYLRILNSTRADIPEDLQQYWIDNQERLGLTGKFLPDDSKLIPYKTV